MRVLVVKTSSMGDVIHTLPALTDARRHFPDIVFDWVVEEAFAEIPAWHPAVDRVIPIALRRWRKTPMKIFGSHEWREFRIELARKHYDYIIDAQGLIKSAWITRFAKGASYGLDRHSIREPMASLSYQYRIPVARDMHAVERVRELFAKVLGYEKPVELGDYGLSRERFASAGQVVDPYVVFLHGTTRADKHWPTPYWRLLAKKTTAQGVKVRLPWGNEIEYERAKKIALDIAGVEVLPQLNLTAIAGVLAQAAAVVAVDTGLGHLSAALGVPAISLYGSTSPKLVGAYGLNQVHFSVADVSAEVEIGEGNTAIEPAIFAPLTADLVWERLQLLLDSDKTGSAEGQQ